MVKLLFFVDNVDITTLSQPIDGQELKKKWKFAYHDGHYNKYYTFLIYDQDIHHLIYLEINMDGNTEYIEEDFPKLDHNCEHRYVVYLYQQEELLTLPENLIRSNFSLKDFTKDYQLTHLDEIIFRVNTYV